MFQQVGFFCSISIPAQRLVILLEEPLRQLIVRLLVGNSWNVQRILWELVPFQFSVLADQLLLRSFALRAVSLFPSSGKTLFCTYWRWGWAWAIVSRGMWVFVFGGAEGRGRVSHWIQSSCQITVHGYRRTTGGQRRRVKKQKQNKNLPRLKLLIVHPNSAVNNRQYRHYLCPSMSMSSKTLQRHKTDRNCLFQNSSFWI